VSRSDFAEGSVSVIITRAIKRVLPVRLTIADYAVVKFAFEKLQTVRLRHWMHFNCVSIIQILSTARVDDVAM